MINPSRTQGDWIPLEDVLAVISRIKSGEWEWWRNQRCKYIGVRIDMRDGYCYLTDREGKPITLEELQYQLPQRKGGTSS